MAVSLIQRVAIPHLYGGASRAIEVAGLAAGSAVYVGFMMAAASGQTAPISSVQLQEISGPGGSNVGSPINLTAEALQPMNYNEHKALAVFRVTGISAMANAKILLNCAYANAYSIGDIWEFGIPEGLDTDSPDTDWAEQVTQIILRGPVSGDYPRADGYQIAITTASDGTFSAIGWTTPPGFTKHSDQPDGTAGKQSFASFSRALSSATGGDVTLASSVADDYGRAAILVALVPQQVGGTNPQFAQFDHEDATPAGVSGVGVVVFEAPESNEVLLGAKLFSATAQQWVATTVGGKSIARMRVPVPAGVTIGTGTDVRVVGNADDNSSAFFGVNAGSIVEG